MEQLHVFGVQEYVFIPSEKMWTLYKKSRFTIFVGYDEYSKGFRIMDSKTMSIQVYRDARFKESHSREDIVQLLKLKASDNLDDNNRGTGEISFCHPDEFVSGERYESADDTVAQSYEDTICRTIRVFQL